MRRIKLIWLLYPVFLGTMLITLLGMAWYASRTFNTFYSNSVEKHLKDLAYTTERLMSGLVNNSQKNVISQLCEELGQKTSTRITVLDITGKVLGDSRSDPGKMENHANRPEIMAAMNGATQSSIRFSKTLSQQMMYVAVPILAEQKVVGIVRTSVALKNVGQTLREIYVNNLDGVLILALLSMLISFLISRGISRPLERIREGAKQFASGNFMEKLPSHHSEEIDDLVHTLNQMVDKLNDQIQQITHQRNEKELILNNMKEGVLAVDHDENIMDINPAAAKIMGVQDFHVKGRHLLELTRNRDLKRFINRTLESDHPIQDEIAFWNENELTLQISGMALRDIHGNRIGSLIVFSDVSRIRKLEHIRSEFVANVSHELKTPITSIQGAVETLLDGASQTPADLERFLKMIERQSHRLLALIEDLLDLSRIEQDAEQGLVELTHFALGDVVTTALQNCHGIIEDKQMIVDNRTSDSIKIHANPLLMEQALTNLLTNAFKYSDPGKTVTIDASEQNQRIMIHVQDQGWGIPDAHLPRLFERFYRVDKSRSREMGGTGLGLAIVKHIVHAHKGQLSVKSELRKGSVFTIEIPITPPMNQD
ncbi:MAG: PAS domain-containing protein [SAR324 cluster bacterium]|nr:PAS domain-containing protein [SAR324 cluster bacterium]